MSNNNYLSSPYFDYSRLYLTQLPRAIKNRNMDYRRQNFRTSSEEYGHFWKNDLYIRDDVRRPVSVASNWPPYDPYREERNNNTTPRTLPEISPRNVQFSDTNDYNGSYTSRSEPVVRLPALVSRSPDDELRKHHYRVTVDLASNGLASSLLDIAGVDVNLKLRDDSSVTIHDVPITFRR